MTMQSMLAIIAVILAPCLGLAHATAPAAHKPNIVLILADDLGWSDLGCYGADLIETPHIDRLAADGVRFTQAYAMSVCSPSRATLLTSKHAARLRITIWSEGSQSGPRNKPLLEAPSLHDLPHTEQTLAARLHDAGYLTALVGKWHLGDARHHPETHGFDVNIGGTQWGAPHSFWWPYRGAGRFGPGFRYVPHLEFGTPDEYLTDRLTDEAIRVIDRAGDWPFFLYLAHHAPHTPIEAKADDVADFKAKLGPGVQHRNATYAAMVRSFDESDGLDIGPVLHDPAARLDRDALFFHYPHYYETTTPVSAVRMRDWKLLEYFEDGRLELYNLRGDPSERTDLAARMSDRAAAMARRLRHWRTAVDAAMPTPNPDFKAKK